jgi:hypothetical protein
MDSSYLSVLCGSSPETSFLQASCVSWMISTAYFFDLASPEKAKTFCHQLYILSSTFAQLTSGLPSGIL